MQKYKKIIIAFSFIGLLGITSILKLIPQFVETYYSNGIYIGISKLMRYAFGWLPFSVGDILYTIAAIYILRWFLLNRKRIIKDTKNWLLDIITVFSIGYFAFHLLWAFNYYRQPLYKSLNIGHDYTTEQLVKVTQQLIVKANAAHSVLQSIDSIKIELPYSKSDILDKVPNGYTNLVNEFPQLNYQPSSIKKSIYSLPLTYMGYSGYLNPFTNEAQVDGLIPKFKFPTTASHEVAHQLGFAAENEANFIGALAAINNDDAYFKYSGYTFIVRHCLFEIYSREPETYKSLAKSLNKGIRENYKEVSEFWLSYENPLEPLFKKTYDTFLKTNNQAGGMESYSYVVALYVNYFDKT
jgi:hypothetical protein